MYHEKYCDFLSNVEKYLDIKIKIIKNKKKLNESTYSKKNMPKNLNFLIDLYKNQSITLDVELKGCYKNVFAAEENNEPINAFCDYEKQDLQFSKDIKIGDKRI
ncbi:hypothetical protein EDEG_01152 [Edhazardia aedis USNM 41457]|uniref:Uncharacterized protein n=1 Tax=Edhazardia aedis (strain USNM 41457) TaxID=1003232 RepID=J9DQ22_EDHAE|nr:hypothetical protein EDEG_01152 [Edhazardia aedis USNM 41457]|eukprot:EJW04645.1 hypothetical protein EDEG_01152 [Edhazardia aedis USNM 41457]